MRVIAVEQAQVGDRIAEPVHNENGRVLLPVGSRLSAAVLSRLSGWGVSEIVVESERDSERAHDLLDELDHRFAEWEEDALMMQIKQIARDHLSLLL